MTVVWKWSIRSPSKPKPTGLLLLRSAGSNRKMLLVVVSFLANDPNEMSKEVRSHDIVLLLRWTRLAGIL